MGRASSGLQYPERFYAAASYAGFDGSPRSSSKAVRAKFNSESALILYALYQQVLLLLDLIPQMPISTAIRRFSIAFRLEM